MPILKPWTAPDVVMRLVLAARGRSSTINVARYFASRSSLLRRHVPAFDEREVLTIDLRQLAAPLHCGPSSGGLATYYEIVSRQVYAPTPAWRPAPGDLVVDVGANIGVFTLWAVAATGGDGVVHAFEPNPLAVDMLRRGTQQLANVVVHDVACGSETGSSVLHFPPGRLSVGSFAERPDRTSEATVDVVRLDDGLRDVDGEIGLLKVDVEGFELPVLEGAPETLTRTRRVALEVAGADLERCTNYLESAGLRCTGVMSGAWNQPYHRGVIAYYERGD